ncbi:hypothetical protein D3C81_1973140 [compost metagenome]
MGSWRQSSNRARAARAKAWAASDVVIAAASSPTGSSMALEIIGLISTRASARRRAPPSRLKRIEPLKARFSARRPYIQASFSLPVRIASRAGAHRAGDPKMAAQ